MIQYISIGLIFVLWCAFLALSIVYLRKNIQHYGHKPIRMFVLMIVYVTAIAIVSTLTILKGN